MSRPPIVSPRRPDDTPNDDDGHLPTYAEIVARLAATNPAACIGRSGPPNTMAHR